MFTQTLPPEVFRLQREFIQVMEANRDFVWWAESLITEETKELEEAFKAEIQDLENLFKEIGDLIYVVAGFYNTMPAFAPELLSPEKNQELQEILDRAAVVLSTVSQEMQIPLPVCIMCFEEVHKSNMSKLDENGKPVRREDGKILKGPNYEKPSMAKPIAAWMRQKSLPAQKG